MPEWIIWAIVIWFIFGAMGRGCSWSGRRLHRIHGARRALSGSREATKLPGARAASRARAATRQPRSRSRAASKPKETPEERIRRRFVEGRTTVEEYEAELWEELGPKRSSSS